MNYYKQGNAANADKIKAAFEKLGINTNCHSFLYNYGLYFSANGAVRFCDVNDWFANIIKTHPDYKELELPVEPKFKVGDEIKTGNTIDMIAEVDYDTRSYYCVSGRTISFENQELWHLAPKPHYDIANFKPFDKVLVRDRNDEPWRIAFYGYYNEEAHYSHFVGTCWSKQCIPYEGNEALLGTTDPCDEQYINW